MHSYQHFFGAFADKDDVSQLRSLVSGIREKGNDFLGAFADKDDVSQLKSLSQESESKETTFSRNPQNQSSLTTATRVPPFYQILVRKNPVQPQKSPRDYVGETRVSQAVRYREPTPYESLSSRARQTKTSMRRLLHDKATPVRPSRGRPTLAP